MPQKELDLFQFTASEVAQADARAAQIMRSKIL